MGGLVRSERAQLISAIATLTALLWSSCAAAQDGRSTPGSPVSLDAQCKVAPVNAQHEFVAAGVQEGDTLTSVQLADPNSRSTIVRVAVAPGNKTLTLFLHSDGGDDAVIWDFAGEVQRVQRAVVASSRSDRRLAVRGLPAERIEFADFHRCGWRMFPPNDNKESNRAIESIFGRLPDSVAFESNPNLLRLPPAEFTLSSDDRPKGTTIMRQGNDGQFERYVLEPGTNGKMVERRLNDPRTQAEFDLATFYPGGFRRIDAKSVVSPVVVIEPETFPGEAGLVQLERAQAIRPARADEIAAYVQGARRARGDRIQVNVDYVILRDIMLPAGLYGAQEKSFLVLRGVAPPRGNAGHGCVFFMDGFRASSPDCLDK